MAQVLACNYCFENEPTEQCIICGNWVCSDCINNKRICKSCQNQEVKI